jgi:CheY-like chemotaxis protein
LRYLEQAHIDLVLTDLGLPGMSGPDFCNEVRRRWPDVAIVFATGLDEKPALDDHNRTALLRKPFSIDELGAVLKEVF